MEKENKIKDFIIKHKWLSKIKYIYFLARGEYNENYIIESENQKYVFRINHGSQLNLDNQIEYEFFVLKALEDSTVTPKVFNYTLDTGDFDKGVLLMEYLEGIPLNYMNDIEKASFIFAKIHSQPVKSNFIIQSNPFRDIADESYNMLNKYDYKEYHNVKLLLYDYYEKMLDFSKNAEQYFMDEEMCIVNTEVNSNNFIINDTNCYLIDWEKSVVSYRYQDLSHFLVPTTTLWKSDYSYNLDEKKIFITKYKEFLKIAISVDELIEKTLLVEKIILLRALSWCYMAYYEYRYGKRNLKNQDTFNKIKQYLKEAECFLK